MGEILASFASSHSPQVSSPWTSWPSLAERDRNRSRLLGRDGEWHTFSELELDGDFKPYITNELWEEYHRRAQDAIASLQNEILDLEPDVVVIVGDDQHELFGDDGTPTMGIYWGDEIVDLPRSNERAEHLSEAQRLAAWSVHAERPESYPVNSSLGKHLIDTMMLEEFDVFQFREQRKDRGVGHAFTFVKRRLLDQRPIPIVPIMVNTYFPPNQPSAKRCFEFGRAIRRAIESWPSPERVLMVASGGLSHVTLDEPLDQRILAAFAKNDLDSIYTIPRNRFQAGTSEILNWIVVAGASENLTMEMVDYIAAYRSTAGTGVGMGFARWR